MIISYKGESLETNHWCELSDDVFAELKKVYYAKPNIDDVKKEMVKISNGGIKNSRSHYQVSQQIIWENSEKENREEIAQ